MIVYNKDTFKTITCVLYSTCIYRLSKTSGIYYRDITKLEYEKCRKDCIVFEGLNINNEMLH